MGANELDEINERYRRRRAIYDPLDAWMNRTIQERERAIVRWMRSSLRKPPGSATLLEIGCGSGDNLLQFLRLGFRPENLSGNELIADRVALARHRLPVAIELFEGNAGALDARGRTYDIVFQSMVFSSILDDMLRKEVAARMWSLVKPGGGVLSYDFVFNNPSNPDVRRVPNGELRRLFPAVRCTSWRLTLAPPIARRVSGLFPPLYGVFNALPFLRTHRLVWLEKS